MKGPASPREDELLRLLGPAGFLRLVEARGGTRLYVPSTGDRTALSQELGQDVVDRLVESHRRNYIIVPLAREFRARHYRAAGQSNSEIALRLCVTEKAVEKMFGRMAAPPVKGSGDPRQLRLFG